MSGVSEAIVREFLETRGFLVRQQRKFVAPGLLTDDEIDFFIVNPRCQATRKDFPAVVMAADLEGIARAAVAVKGWHTETFSAAMLAQEPELVRFTDADQMERSARSFGLEPPFTRVLVVPSLPQTQADREEAVAALRARGVDCILPFRAILGDLILHIEVNRNYARSDILQVLRILKNYDLLKDPSLELFRPRRPGKGR